MGLYIEGIDDASAFAAFAALAERARDMGKGVVAIKSGKTALLRTAAASHTASLAGGEAGLVADLAAPYGIDFPPGPQATHDRLFAVLGEIPTISNPLDYHTFIWGDGPKTTEVFSAMPQAYDAGIYIIDSPRADRWDPSGYQPAFDAIIAAQNATGKIALPVASMEQGVCALLGLQTALAAIKATQTPAGVPVWRPVVALPPRDCGMLTEAEGKALLAAAGVAVPQSRTGARLSDLDVAGLTAPYALKGLGFAHKTEAGAVRLGLSSLEGHAEMPGVTAYLVEEMITGAVAEILLGLRRDPVDGYRGRARADMAVARIAVALGAQMLAHQSLEEIEMNPMLVRPQGAVAVDALIRKV